MLKVYCILVASLAGIWAADYEMILEDPDVFSPCTEPPPGSVGVKGLLNLDNLVTSQDSETIHISENVSTTWEVEPTDRISARIAMMHFNRGTWEPTVFSVATPDFCSVMFNEDQYWYKYWTKHIINREEAEKNCLRVPGTILAHKPFDVQLLVTNIRGATLHGRYKAVVTFEAIDEKNAPRPNTICFEIRGEVEKL
ncbi:uncharacterized protein Dana_GF11757 [Drosophila ananassae]|uniref:Uncharacterized protein n=1 Tax=Drosophila ananassae TaxID=7217 RepID=B3MGR3_DROAN|nr:uncharacterized protein LOC6494619 [Drosophila ananassae]EDV36821.1 uncharacterized protein Dana_GF11757 [Drosophila ananassae]